MPRTALLARAVLVAALVTGLMAVDEYVPLLAADGGATPATPRCCSPGVGVAEAAARRWPGASPRRAGPLGALLAGAAVAVARGALLPVGPGFAAIAGGSACCR